MLRLSLLYAFLALVSGSGAVAAGDCGAAGECRAAAEGEEPASLLQLQERGLEGRAAGEHARRQPPKDFGLPFGYSVMGPGGELVARLIVAHTEPCPKKLVVKTGPCPKNHFQVLSFDVPVAIHAEPVVGHSNFFIDGERYNSMQGQNISVANFHPAFDFPDRVCEARFEYEHIVAAYFDLGAAGAVGVPLPPQAPSRFVVVADTGLRLKSTNDGWCKSKNGSPKTLYGAKTCPDADLLQEYDPSLVAGRFQSGEATVDPALNGWPFPKVAERALEEVHKAGGGAIVVHVGDYLYRHEACPFPFPKNLTDEQRWTLGDCTKVGSAWGDTHDAWVADFFRPAAGLLRAAPWIMHRGNHEDCKRGGMGYFRYLDPRVPSDIPTATAQYPWCVTMRPAYSVELPNDLWIVLDTADLPDQEVDASDGVSTGFTPQDAAKFANTEVPPVSPYCTNATSGKEDLPIFEGVKEIVAKADPQKRVWIGSHRPIFGITFEDYETDDGSNAQLYSYSCEIPNAFSMLGAGYKIPNVMAVVSGHFHSFQMIQYEKRPAQVTLGNGGTQLYIPIGVPWDLGLAANKNITVLGEEIVNSPMVGEFGYGVLYLEAGKRAALRAKFLHEKSYPGHSDVTGELTPKAFAVPGTGWRELGPGAARRSRHSYRQAQTHRWHLQFAPEDFP